MPNTFADVGWLTEEQLRALSEAAKNGKLNWGVAIEGVSSGRKETAAIRSSEECSDGQTGRGGRIPMRV